MPLKPGDRIERYVIDGMLGSGGMGEVYRAHDPRLKRAIALKILHVEESPDPSKSSSPASGAGARMMREAQLAAALDHPNVVAIFDVGQIEQPPELRGTTYLAMELIRGAPLRKFIGDASVRMKVRVRWLEEIARALGAAHAAGLVHRDVKPENVMVRDDGIVKVLDFGIAKRTIAAPVDPTSSTEGQAVPTMTKEGAIVGTPFYMAPEQLRAEVIDGRADQFAWGVVAYELLTGKPLWSSEGGGYSLVAQILQAPVPSLAGVTGVTPRVAETVARALAKDPGARFATMGALVEGLTGKGEREDTEPKIPLSVSSPDLMERQTSEAPTQTAAESTPPVPAPPTETKRSAPAVNEAARSATRRSERPPRPRKLPPVVLLAVLGAAAVAGVLALSRTPKPASVAHSAAPSRACASNAECGAKLHAAALCRSSDGQCVPLASAECTVLADDAAVSDDTTIWVGSMLPLSGPEASSYGTANANAIDLARRDFSQSMATVIAHHGARPIGVISCDDTRDPSRIAHRLADDLQVPAVIGFSTASEAIDLAESVFFPRDVMMVVALNTSPLLATLPHPAKGPRLLWRTTYNTVQTVPAISAFVEERLEPQIRSKHLVSPGAPLRVALLRRKNAAELAFSDALFRGLSFNGKSALDNTGNFREFVCGEACAKPDGGVDPSLVDGLLEFAPQIVIISGVTEALIDRVLAPLERRLPRTAPRPDYVNIMVLSPAVFRFVDSRPDLRARFFGLTVVSNTAQNARFVMHYNETFDDKITRTISPNTAYDAFYLLAYATYAVGSGTVTGATLAGAMTRLVPPGDGVDVGPSTIFDGFNALTAGRGIDFVGATGPLDFNVATGEAPVDMIVLCVGANARGEAVDTVESGLVYRAAERRLDGAMRCP